MVRREQTVLARLSEAQDENTALQAELQRTRNEAAAAATSHSMLLADSNAKLSQAVKKLHTLLSSSDPMPPLPDSNNITAEQQSINVIVAKNESLRIKLAESDHKRAIEAASYSSIVAGLQKENEILAKRINHVERRWLEDVVSVVQRRQQEKIGRGGDFNDDVSNVDGNLDSRQFQDDANLKVVGMQTVVAQPADFIVALPPIKRSIEADETRIQQDLSKKLKMHNNNDRDSLIPHRLALSDCEPISHQTLKEKQLLPVQGDIPMENGENDENNDDEKILRPQASLIEYDADQNSFSSSPPAILSKHTAELLNLRLPTLKSGGKALASNTASKTNAPGSNTGTTAKPKMATTAPKIYQQQQLVTFVSDSENENSKNEPEKNKDSSSESEEEDKLFHDNETLEHHSQEYSSLSPPPILLSKINAEPLQFKIPTASKSSISKPKTPATKKVAVVAVGVSSSSSSKNNGNISSKSKSATTTPTYKHQEGAQRNKVERRKMHGTTCPCCNDFYEAVGNVPPILELGQKLPQGHDDGDNDGGSVAHLQKVSRHRTRFLKPETPEGFWDVGFPSTQEVEERNQRSKEKRK
ncbi:hypothetical protein HK100_002246 [Physocladia obscura]|uniref:DNA endonuclease activator Ctp1 C-terminal domain-containing protein n=1 Tax=Physocladia obscura TaxID=109957 RepID=A0AAD5XDZ7_9FUNG|nr:hypothetical protein HK100_002246 [Physocladia obscura]